MDGERRLCYGSMVTSPNGLTLTLAEVGASRLIEVMRRLVDARMRPGGRWDG